MFRDTGKARLLSSVLVSLRNVTTPRDPDRHGKHRASEYYHSVLDPQANAERTKIAYPSLEGAKLGAAMI